MAVSYEKVSHKFLELNSCGCQILEGIDRSCVRKNGRKDYHFLYITEGVCYLEDHKVEAGNLILFKPDEPQYYRFSADVKTVSRYMHFSGVGCEELIESCNLNRRVTFVGKSERLQRVFDIMHDEYVLKRPFFSESCAGLLWQFIAFAGQRAQERISTAIYPEKNLDMVCRMMYEEFALDKSIADYAKLVNLSESRFSHAFKERTGLSPKAFITRIKIENACRLLEDPNLSLAEVAHAIGVNDLNYFSRLIKKHTGHTPSYFRNMC